MSIGGSATGGLGRNGSATSEAMAHGATEHVAEMPPYDPADFWDEMFEAPDRVRPHYARLARRLATLGPEEVARRQAAAELSFQVRGITFAVNQGAEGIEKIMPFDLVPRMIRSDEWRQIERGLEQRVRALNLFLHDIYHEQAILRDGIVPADLILGNPHFRPLM